jgi:amino acid permease
MARVCKNSIQDGLRVCWVSEMEVSKMSLIATVMVVIALVVLLILGFLRVARELLSRSICEVPSSHDKESFRQTTLGLTHPRKNVSS